MDTQLLYIILVSVPYSSDLKKPENLNPCTNLQHIEPPSVWLNTSKIKKIFFIEIETNKLNHFNCKSIFTFEIEMVHSWNQPKNALKYSFKYYNYWPFIVWLNFFNFRKNWILKSLVWGGPLLDKNWDKNLFQTCNNTI